MNAETKVNELNELSRQIFIYEADSITLHADLDYKENEIPLGMYPCSKQEILWIEDYQKLMLGYQRLLENIKSRGPVDQDDF